MEQGEEDSCFGDLFQERILADDLFLFQSLTVQHYDKQRNRLVFKYRVGSGAVMTSFALVPLLPRNGFSSISQETTGTENCCDRATASNHTQTAAETDSQDDRNSARDVNDSPACDREILLSEFSRAHLLAVFSVGMCVLPWYWMGFATSSITISSAIAAAVGISAEDVAFWQTLYTNVLMEFMYVNKLAYPITLSVEEQTHNQLVSDGIDHLSATEGSKNRNGSVGDSQSQRQRINSCGGGNYNSMTATEEDKKKVFVPLGGGKDSLVVWHLEKVSGREPLLLYVADGCEEYENSWRLQRIVEETQSDFVLMKHFLLDSNYWKHRRSPITPCGHPWAALVLFDAVLASLSTGVNTIVMGHEKSADEGNGIVWQGLEVNHQYDKSSVFLSLAVEYIHSNINSTISITSSVSDLWELEITRIFCEDLQRFHTLFLSCNEPINGTEWCNKCEKCVFVFLLLSAYLAPDKTESIFGKNLFRQVELLPVFKNLLGITGTKPFECVGTVDEARAALRLAVQQYQQFYGDMNSSEISRECNRASFATIIDGEESTACLPIEDVEGHSSSSAETCNRNEDCVRIPPLLLELRSLFLN